LAFVPLKREAGFINVDNVFQLLRLVVNLACCIVLVGEAKFKQCLRPSVEPLFEIFKRVPKNSPLLTSVGLG
jgi:hypothetical protein